MNLFRWSPRIAQYPSLGAIPPSQWEKESQYLGAAEPDHAYADAPVYEADQRLFQEGRKPARGCLAALRARQFRAPAQEPPHHPGHLGGRV
jgi:hypothetical protein